MNLSALNKTSESANTSMLNFSFTVATADDARIAAEVCDFLAERLVPGAAPAKRTRGKSKEVTDGNTSFSAPASSVDMTSAITSTTDPVALYAALAGSLPDAAELAAAQVPEPSSTPLATEAELKAAHPTPDVDLAALPLADRVKLVRDAVSAKGGKWFAEWMMANKMNGKKLSEYSADEFANIYAAARA